MKKIVILAPISNNYINYFDAISGDKDNRYLIFAMERHRDNYPETLPENIKFVFLKIWNEEYIDYVISQTFGQQIDYVYAYSEEEIIFAAKLRKKYQVTLGQSLTSAEEFRNKLTMVKAAEQAHVAVPRYWPVDNVFDLIEAEKKLGFPFVLKPIAGMGSMDTFVVHDHVELERLAADKILRGYLAEEFIPWPLYHVDGFVKQGHFVYLISSKYFANTLEVKNGKSVGSVQISPTAAEQKLIRSYVTDLLKGMDTPENYLFHLEVFCDGREVKLCEIGSRLGGGRILQELEQGLGFSPIQELLKLDLGLPNKVDLDKEYKSAEIRGFVMVEPGRGILQKLPAADAVLAANPEVYDYYQYAKLGRTYNGAASSVEALAAISVCGKDSRTVEEKLKDLDAWLKKAAVYS